MPLTQTQARDRIRELNDALRITLDSKLGKVVMTQGFADFRPRVHEQVIQAMRAFDKFDEANDPNGEHDFGSIEIAGQKFYWKIDYYDPSLEFGSEDPTDPSKTTRVLTIMLAEDY